MKSNKQRKREIKIKRQKKAALKAASSIGGVNYRPLHYVEADLSALTHHTFWSYLPRYYEDKPFKCRDCGKHEVWKASSQKWWYEVIKGHIDSTAVRCLGCRKKLRAEKENQKKHMQLMAQRQPHPNELFFKKRY